MNPIIGVASQQSQPPRIKRITNTVQSMSDSLPVFQGFEIPLWSTNPLISRRPDRAALRTLEGTSFKRTEILFQRFPFRIPIKHIEDLVPGTGGNRRNAAHKSGRIRFHRNGHGATPPNPAAAIALRAREKRHQKAVPPPAALRDSDVAHPTSPHPHAKTRARGCQGLRQLHTLGRPLAQGCPAFGPNWISLRS